MINVSIREDGQRGFFGRVGHLHNKSITYIVSLTMLATFEDGQDGHSFPLATFGRTGRLRRKAVSGHAVGARLRAS
jgi:hypothetical protein